MKRHVLLLGLASLAVTLTGAFLLACGRDTAPIVAPTPSGPAVAPRALSRGMSAPPRAAGIRATGAALSVLRFSARRGSEAGELLADGKRFLIVEQHAEPCNEGRDINTRHAPLEQLASNDCLFGPRCLVFEGLAAQSGCGPDRLEVDVVEGTSPEALRFGQTRYLRFFLKVDAGLADLRNAALISQVWQHSSVAYGARPPLGPAFAVSIKSNRDDPDLIDVDFRYRNEVSAENTPHFFVQRTIKKNEWHSFHVRMTPRHVGDPAGPGEILVWADQGLHPTLRDRDALNYRSEADDGGRRFYWGYAPDPDTRLGTVFDVRVGLYRPEPLVAMKFWLDGVKLADDVNSLSE